MSENASVPAARVSPPVSGEPTVVEVRPLRSASVPPAAETPPRTPLAGERRRRRLRQEFAVRLAVASLLLLFNEAFTADHATSSIVRLTAFLGLVLNVPYYLAIRTGVALRAQAYARMLIDVSLMTGGLYGAGGLGAAQFLGLYTIVPIYTAFVFSGRASMLATLFATGTYLLVVALQLADVLPFTHLPVPNAWLIVGFNLLIVNIVGSLAALLAEAYQVSRQQLAVLCDELEGAHAESLKLNLEIQGVARRFVLAEVVAGVTHDVRNALQGAFGHLWLARRTSRPLSPEAVSHLDQAEQACESAMRIVRTTLDMAQRPTPEREPVDPADIVRRVVQLKAVEFRRDGITLETDVADQLPTVLGSRYQLMQVLLDLVDNAQEELRHGEARRLITLAARSDNGRVILEVRDTGRGIAPNVLPHVFEPFYTTKAGGAGLGLAISAGIVESFGGTLTAENRRDGGAVFRLTLPVAGRRSLRSTE